MEATDKILAEDLIRQLRQYKKELTDFIHTHNNALFVNPNIKLENALTECDRMIDLIKREFK